MSDLNFFEKSKLEKLFGMAGGYVLNFCNRSFHEFVADSVRRDIYCGKYNRASNSKANLLRKFWEVEPNPVVAKLLTDLLKLEKEVGPHPDNDALFEECYRIVERLRQGTPIDELEAIGEELTEKEFDLLVKSIRVSIDANEPEAGLDRLHTLITKFIRCLCEKQGITFSKEKPLHSLLGEYIKKMKEKGTIETLMTERILKSSIANLEAFNSVRNEHSFAHDNPVLNYDESLLIFNNVVSAIRFIQALERRYSSEDEKSNGPENDEVPW